jgi:(Z)-2-((N-methylformamido)methylene)-5-hydroxybutyrolactone dehydrogenase
VAGEIRTPFCHRTLDSRLFLGDLRDVVQPTSGRKPFASRCAQEEIFGPVLSVIPFVDEDEAVAIANDSPYGLAAGVWTQSIRRSILMSERLRAGTVWVNTYRAVSFMSPFGGYMRSGLGRENGQDEYLQQ